MAETSGGSRESRHGGGETQADAGAGGEVESEAGPEVDGDAASDGSDTPPPELADSRFRDPYDDDPTPPPARPVMSDQTKPPILRKFPAPRSIKAARTFWLLSFVLSGAGVFLAFLSHASVTDELTEVLGRLAPSYDESSIDSLVDVIYWSCVAGLAVIIAVEASLLAVMLNRRSGARWIQLVLLCLHAGVVLVASAFLSTGDWGALIELLLLVGFVAALAAWVLSLVPSAHRWFRMKDETQALD